MQELTDEQARQMSEECAEAANNESGGLAQRWRNGAGERAHYARLTDEARERGAREEAALQRVRPPRI